LSPVLSDIMKGIFLVLSGVADEPCRALGRATPLQTAKTPNLDALAKKSRVDCCHPVKEGVAPDGSSAIVSLLGGDHRLASRGSLEAVGAGVKFTRGDLALSADFATIDSLKEGNILDSRAGRTLSAKESKILAKTVNDNVKLPFEFEFHPTHHHKGIVVFRGGFSNNITNANPFYGNGVAYAGISPKISFSKPMDEEDDSRLSSDLVNSFVRKSHEVLDVHDLNVSRAKKGLFSANYILCRDAGNEVTKFKKLKGSWMALGYSPLEKGIAKAYKMDTFDFSYPKMKGIDVYNNLNAGLKKAIKSSIKMIKKNKSKYDYFYIHLKETEAPGKDNKPFEKVRMIELIDKKLLGFLGKFVEKNNLKLIVASDSTTSCRLKAHTSDAVPVLFYDPENVKDEEKRFTEEQALEGRKFIGRKLLEKTLFSK
jgi:2,3-bisphosphoglycerate-independent phosphoglycerate mutase